MFVIMKNLDSKSKKNYYVIRAKQKLISSSIKRYTILHKNSVEIIKIEYNPNSVNLWDRIKTQLKGKINYCINDFGLTNGYRENKLVEDIKAINEERYNVE